MSIEKRFSEFLTTENSVLALIDHQTGLLASIRDIEPDLFKTNLKALAKLINADINQYLADLIVTTILVFLMVYLALPMWMKVFNKWLQN